MHFQRIHDTPMETFERLLRRIQSILKRYGRPFIFSNERGDYWVLDDDWGSGQVLVHFMHLKMLDPCVIRALRTQLRLFPGWEIVVIVDLLDKPDWPEMGLFIRPGEVVDWLKRDFFPPEFRAFHYEDARPGGIAD